MPMEFPRQEVRDAEGRTVAYVVAADVMEKMTKELEEGRKTLALEQLIRDRKFAAGKAAFMAAPLQLPLPTEEDFKNAVDNTSQLDEIISALRKPKEQA